ncbi:hypothetical protein Micbo1qcDRAFT_155761 [Microdochium bolleyi]|uniref:Secreted protein n=1 Tax=Microdochium bolleyi TaxID=196109 RepID=A0A136JIS1_9PEZI|nr:hypothetical protein Micbo1qcDRAFT_155761 [Microdochium bolleyi]
MLASLHFVIFFSFCFRQVPQGSNSPHQKYDLLNRVHMWLRHSPASRLPGIRKHHLSQPPPPRHATPRLASFSNEQCASV